MIELRTLILRGAAQKRLDQMFDFARSGQFLVLI